jgi:hypothetical protein
MANGRLHAASLEWGVSAREFRQYAPKPRSSVNTALLKPGDCGEVGAWRAGGRGACRRESMCAAVMCCGVVP